MSTSGAHNADPVRLFLVWNTDQSGVFLDSIHATREAADKAGRDAGVLLLGRSRLVD